MGKTCPHHGKDHNCKSKCSPSYCHSKFFQWLLAGLLSFIIVVLIIILVIWLVLRPTKPTFYLQDGTIYSFNTTGGPPNLLNTNIQVTISTRNPNSGVGIYYKKLDVYATYKNQPITPAVAVPPIYQGHKDVVLWSPFLCGVDVPLAPYLVAALEQDHAAGLLLLYVKIDGRIRWKVGSWISGHYHLFVNCPALLTFGGGWGPDADGGYTPPVVRFQLRVASCSVSV